MAGAAALPLCSRDLLALGLEIQREMGPGAALKTLNPHQDAIVTTMAELIIPATETPGAKGARVNEFIDLVLTDWCGRDQCARFLAGLANTDKHSRSLFGKDFVSCSPQEQVQLLTILDEELTQLREEEEMRPRRIGPTHQDEESGVTQNFFHTMKRLTLVGYYTSEIGWTQELNRPDVHFGPYRGCVPLEKESSGS
jgi:hypothetical protein